MDCILHGQNRREPAELNGEGSAGTGQCTVQTLKLSWSWSLKQASAVLSIIITVSRWMWRRPHVCEYYSRLHPKTNINRAEQWSAVAKETSWQYQTTQLNIVGEKITQSVLPQKLAFACSVPCTPMNAPELKVQHRGCSHLLTSNGNNTAKHTPLIYYPHTGILALKLINWLIKTLMLLVFF